MSAIISAADVIDATSAVDDADKAQRLADQLAEGLDNLARFVRDNPQFADEMRYTLGQTLSVPLTYRSDQRSRVAAFARALTRAGHKITKKPFGTGDKLFGFEAKMGPLGFGLAVWGARDEVCERVVVGTETVTRQVPDPELLAAVPIVTVTETVEQVEWRCGSLLAPADEPQAVTR